MITSAHLDQLPRQKPINSLGLGALRHLLPGPHFLR